MICKNGQWRITVVHRVKIVMRVTHQSASYTYRQLYGGNDFKLIKVGCCLYYRFLGADGYAFLGLLF